MKSENSNGREGKQILDEIVGRNVGAVQEIEEASYQRRSSGQVVSDAIAGFCGSTTFIWVHCVLFGGWLSFNSFEIVPQIYRFDPPPFPILKLVVSLEAIFLSTFILISQNRQKVLDEERSHLSLQINLIAEEQTSHILSMLSRVENHLGIETETSNEETEIEALTEKTDVKQIIEHIGESNTNQGTKSDP